VTFELEEERNTAADLIEKFIQGLDPVLSHLEGKASQLGNGFVANEAAAVGKPVDGVIVKNHGFSFGRDLEVAFDRIPAFDRPGEGARRILDRTHFQIVQSAMRDRTGD
jgi:hypothetical protein